MSVYVNHNNYMHEFIYDTMINNITMTFRIILGIWWYKLSSDSRESKNTSKSSMMVLPLFHMTPVIFLKNTRSLKKKFFDVYFFPMAQINLVKQIRSSACVSLQYREINIIQCCQLYCIITPVSTQLNKRDYSSFLKIWRSLCFAHY